MADVQARREVSELVSSMVDAGGGLPLPEDRLLTIMEAAQVPFSPPSVHVSSPCRTYTPLLPSTVALPACDLLSTHMSNHTKSL